MARTPSSAVVTDVRLRDFRILVVASWCLYVLYWFYAYLPAWTTPYVTWLGTHDSRVVAIMRADGYAALVSMPDLVSVIFFWGWLVAAIGVFFIQNWGRYLYLALLLAGFVHLGLSGMIAIAPFEAVLIGVMNVLDGAIVALAFFSPLSACFAERPPSGSAKLPPIT